MRTGLWLTIVLLFGLTASAAADLSGKWSCDDGGTYYLRQTGRTLYWYGTAGDPDPAWATVFSGRIYDKRINGRWADVPNGRATGAGALELAIEDNGNRLRAVRKDGGYRGSQWKRPASQARVSRQRLQPAAGDTCAGFDPSVTRVEQIDGRWMLIDERHWLFDFGTDRPAAHRAVKVVRHYKLDRLCAIGTSEAPRFSYLLAKGGTPWGPMTDETCSPIDPGRLTVINRQGHWVITSGTRRLFDFGRRQAAAEQALATIRQHGFTHQCRVGQPRTGFTYFRR